MCNRSPANREALFIVVFQSHSRSESSRQERWHSFLWIFLSKFITPELEPSILLEKYRQCLRSRVVEVLRFSKTIIMFRKRRTTTNTTMRTIILLTRILQAISLPVLHINPIIISSITGQLDPWKMGRIFIGRLIDARFQSRVAIIPMVSRTIVFDCRNCNIITSFCYRLPVSCLLDFRFWYMIFVVVILNLYNMGG